MPGSRDAESAAGKKRTELVERRADAAFLIETFAATERKARELARIPRTTSRYFLAWGMERRIALNYVQPGKPTQNAYAESFNGKFRDECLNVSWFRNLWEARRRIAAWREEYNGSRPHSSLGNMTPNEFVAALIAQEKAVLQT